MWLALEGRLLRWVVAWSLRVLGSSLGLVRFLILRGCLRWSLVVVVFETLALLLILSGRSESSTLLRIGFTVGVRLVVSALVVGLLIVLLVATLITVLPLLIIATLSVHLLVGILSCLRSGVALTWTRLVVSRSLLLLVAIVVVVTLLIEARAVLLLGSALLLVGVVVAGSGGLVGVSLVEVVFLVVVGAFGFALVVHS